MSVDKGFAVRAVLTAHGEQKAFEYGLRCSKEQELGSTLSGYDSLLECLSKLRENSNKAMTQLVEVERAKKGETGTEADKEVKDLEGLTDSDDDVGNDNNIEDNPNYSNEREPASKKART